MGKTAEDYEDQYTKPELRARLKEEIKESDKGGKFGQWSARKSQLLTQRYEAEGGGYKGEKTDEQKSLERWTNEDWQTQEGNAAAIGEGEDGSTKRYLPEKAWDLLSDEEKEKTDRKKQREGEEEAKQFVDNTAKAKAARKFVSHGDASDLTVDMLQRLDRNELYDLARQRDVSGRSKMDKEELAHAIHDSFTDEAADLDDKTRGELYERAQKLDISGRSKMDKDELVEAISESEK
ncbi:MAG: Rho termination factor N-terminal domain-containing protein [Planctomycetota bacterium]